MNTVTLPDTSALYVNGGWRKATATGRIPVLNPATEQQLTDVPIAADEDVDAAVRAAAAALPGWAALPPEERAAYCRRIAQGLSDRAEELTDVVVADLGMPRRLARLVQIGLGVTDFTNFAKAAEQHVFERTLGRSTVRDVPVGVVAAITPWNFPLHQIAAKVGGALAAGCTVVLKPSEVTPLVAFSLTEVIAGLGLPDGVFNLLIGPGPTVGEALVRHRLVDLVSFTGSTRAGARVASLAGERARPVSLELGGKSPAVLLDDLDDQAFDKALRKTMASAFLNSGQACNAFTRVVVPRARQAAAEEILADAAGTFTPGDPTAPTTRMGPLVSAAQRDRVRGYIERGLADGARLVVGGAEAPDDLPVGYFVRPTVFSDVRPDTTIAREEIFGPVLAVQSYTDIDEAVALANDTEYGLAAAVWGQDQARAEAVAWRLRAGQVDLNGAAYNPVAPFGGFGDSGHGREFGPHGLAEFLTTQSLQH
jgi:acyl-CoA reductase-like NAD-dependent aldehyde dehydrogenase